MKFWVKMIEKVNANHKTKRFCQGRPGSFGNPVSDTMFPRCVCFIRFIRKNLQEKTQENPQIFLVLWGKLRVFLFFFLEFFSMKDSIELQVQRTLVYDFLVRRQQMEQLKLACLQLVFSLTTFRVPRFIFTEGLGRETLMQASFEEESTLPFWGSVCSSESIRTNVAIFGHLGAVGGFGGGKFWVMLSFTLTFFQPLLGKTSIPVDYCFWERL